MFQVQVFEAPCPIIAMNAQIQSYIPPPLCQIIKFYPFYNKFFTFHNYLFEYNVHMSRMQFLNQ